MDFLEFEKNDLIRFGRNTPKLYLGCECVIGYILDFFQASLDLSPEMKEVGQGRGKEPVPRRDVE